MKKKVWKLFLDFEQEEKWLNEMAAKGLDLIDYSIGRYIFEDGKPGEYVYRIELLENLPENPESQDFIAFMEDTGAELVASYFRWAYFRKKKAGGKFDIYSDINSRINHYKRVTLLLGTFVGLNLVIAVYNLLIGLYTGRQQGIYLNVYVSIFSFRVVVLLAGPTIRYIRKVRRMEDDKQIYE